jgi:dihydrofolate synthase/folylpolyglutamate synthase
VNYAAALERLYARSDPERGAGFWSGGGDPNMGPQRTRAMLAVAGNPQDRIRCFHIAGSTGKGATAMYLAAALSGHGFCTGLYTQPHLHTYRERLQVNSAPIREAEFASAFERVLDYERASRRQGPDLGPATTYELTTVMAFDWFHRRGASHAVIETGLGGRLDATNVLSAPAGILLTPIELEHDLILGPGLARIAAEKAAIIRPGSAVVSAPQSAAATRVIAERSLAQNASLQVLGAAETAAARRVIRAPQLAASAALAVQGLALEKGTPDSKINLARMAATSLPARCEVIAARPSLVVDGGHTARAMQHLAQFVGERFSGRCVQLVFGCASDKPAADLLNPWLGRIAGLHLCAAEHPRATQPPALAAVVEFERTAAYPDVPSALAGAGAAAGANGIVVATGSMHVAAAARSETHGEAVGLEPIPAAIVS